jgi:hypothetical protein
MTDSLIPSFNQMAVDRVMIYPHLTLNPLHISLIIKSLLSTSNDYTNQKTHQTQIKSFFHSINSILHIQSYSLFCVCLSQIFIISKKNSLFSFSFSKNPNRVFFLLMSSESQPLVSPSTVPPPSFYSPLDIS